MVCHLSVRHLSVGHLSVSLSSVSLSAFDNKMAGIITGQSQIQVDRLCHLIVNWRAIKSYIVVNGSTFESCKLYPKIVVDIYCVKVRGPLVREVNIKGGQAVHIHIM